mgnify:CR=1 FL=1
MGCFFFYLLLFFINLNLYKTKVFQSSDSMIYSCETISDNEIEQNKKFINIEAWGKTNQKKERRNEVATCDIS